MAAPQQEEEQGCFSNGSLTIVGQSLATFAPTWGEKYGNGCKRLVLSFNELTSLDNLSLFTGLTELVVDNNNIANIGTLPDLPALHTLTLNNNCLDDIEHVCNVVGKRCKNLSYLSLLGNKACPNQVGVLSTVIV